jgi:DNA-binding CsgD family transcriptional regulator
MELNFKTMCYKNLTRREKQIAMSVARGKTYKEIANHLFISPATVDSHVRHIKEKLHVNTEAQIANKVCHHYLSPVDPYHRLMNILKLNYSKL